MKHLPAFLLIVAVFTSSLSAAELVPPAEPKWESLPDMPTPVLAAAISQVGNLAVITGGIPQTGISHPQAQLFDLTTMKWREPMKLIHGRTMHAQVTLADGRVLIAGGQIGTVKPFGDGHKPTELCEILDLETGLSREIEPLPRPIAEPTAHLLPDGRAIVIGGESALIFNPKTNKWSKGIGLREDRQAHASALLADGRVVVVGGVLKQSIEVIDPVAGASKRLGAELPHFNDDCRIAVLPDGRVWILGGQHSTTGYTVEQTWLLDLSDPRKSTITPGPKLQMDKGMADGVIVKTGQWLVLAGGESEFSGGDVELHAARLLDPVNLKVYPMPEAKHPHDDAVAIATERGMIIFGGFVETTMDLPFGGISKKFRVPQAVAGVEQLLLR